MFVDGIKSGIASNCNKNGMELSIILQITAINILGRKIIIPEIIMLFKIVPVSEQAMLIAAITKSEHINVFTDAINIC